MRDTLTVDGLIGIALPLVIAVINRSTWSPKLKGVIAFAACAVAATVAGLVRGDLDWTDWRATFLTILAAAFASYHVLWRPSTIAPSVEVATTPGRSTPVYHAHE